MVKITKLFFCVNILNSRHTCMLERGSPEDAHPIKLFSHLCLVSNSIFQRLILAVPDCMAFFAGL